MRCGLRGIVVLYRQAGGRALAETSDEKPRGGGVSPAGWAAISAVAVALIGAVVTLTTSWWQHAPAKAEAPKPEAVSAVEAPPAEAEAAPAAALPDPTRWAGAWAGTFQDGGERRRIELVIIPGCAKGKACGTIRVPHVPCKGEISLAEVTPDGAEFSVDRFEAGSAAACSPGAGEVFRETPEGALAYTATYSGAKGVLTRVD